MIKINLKFVTLAIAFTVFVLMMPSALADSMNSVNMSISINSFGGNVDIWTTPNSGNGTTNYYLDGVDFDTAITQLDSKITSKTSMVESALTKVYQTFMKESKGVWEYVDPNTLDSKQTKLRQVFDYYFVPRVELFSIINTQQELLNQLSLEVMSLQRLHTEEEVCNARLEVAAELGISDVTCGDTLYQIDQQMGVAIAVKQIYRFSGNETGAVPQQS